MAKSQTVATLRALARPRPPHDVITDPAARFEPDLALTEWVRWAYIEPGGPLFDPGHAHLASASLGLLWTNVENVRQQRRIVGTAEMPSNSLRASKWIKARAEVQLSQWFGHVPDFLITLDADYVSQIDDASFCALVDHELWHCGQAMDEFGAPKFNRETGAPMYAIRGHDVEEFVAVVRRFGLGAGGHAVNELVEATRADPILPAGVVAQACGTCLKAR